MEHPISTKYKKYTFTAASSTHTHTRIRIHACVCRRDTYSCNLPNNCVRVNVAPMAVNAPISSSSDSSGSALYTLLIYVRVCENFGRCLFCIFCIFPVVRDFLFAGERIVNQEQQGKEKAVYGEAILKEWSIALTEEFGKGV